MDQIGPELLGRLIDEHAAALVLYARQWCDSPEDVVQEALLKLAGQSRPPDDVVAWLYRVVRNLAVSAARSAKRRRHHEASAAKTMHVWFGEADQAPIDAQTATAALAGLPSEQREVLVAHLWGGLTFEEIGRLAGCSSSTAHRHYVAGLANLRERLGVACPRQDSTQT